MEHEKRFSDNICASVNVFGKAWDKLRSGFEELIVFFGWITSVFSSAATVENHFSPPQWEQDVHQCCLNNLNIEGITRCKQNEYLIEVKYRDCQYLTVLSKNQTISLEINRGWLYCRKCNKKLLLYWIYTEYHKLQILKSIWKYGNLPWWMRPFSK